MLFQTKSYFDLSHYQRVQIILLKKKEREKHLSVYFSSRDKIVFFTHAFEIRII